MTLTVQITLSFLIGLFIVHYSIPIIVRLSKEKKLFDVPDERKVNKTVIPNLGGVALFSGITIATLLALHKSSFPDYRYILVAMIMLFYIGMKDDILVISAGKKMAVQIIGAFILIGLGDIRFTNLHGFLGFYEINYAFSLFISVFALIAIINAVNLIDGIDGLAGTLCLIATLFYGIDFLVYKHERYAILCFAIVGCLTSFLIYNVFGKKNKIFMGDTGSLILGLYLAVFTIKYNQFALTEGPQVFTNSPVYSFAVISIPLFDMIRVFGMRILQKKSPFAPDMNHLHHKLLNLGYSHLKATLIISGTNLFIIGIVFAFSSANVYLLALMVFSILVLLTILPGFISEKQKSKELRLSYITIPLKINSTETADQHQHSGLKTKVGLRFLPLKKIKKQKEKKIYHYNM